MASDIGLVEMETNPSARHMDYGLRITDNRDSLMKSKPSELIQNCCDACRLGKLPLLTGAPRLFLADCVRGRVAHGLRRVGYKKVIYRLFDFPAGTAAERGIGTLGNARHRDRLVTLAHELRAAGL